MAHSRRFGSQTRFGGSQRRKTGWSAGPANAQDSETSAGTVIWSTGQAAQGDGLTIVRLHGELTMFIEAATTAQDGFRSIAHGICIVSQNAAGVGVTAVPAPIDDLAWDGWLWHSLTEQVRGFLTTEEGSPLSVVRLKIDSKAMRKVRSLDTIVGVSQFGTEVGAATLTWSARTRMLFKIP